MAWQLQKWFRDSPLLGTGRSPSSAGESPSKHNPCHATDGKLGKGKPSRSDANLIAAYETSGSSLARNAFALWNNVSVFSATFATVNLAKENRMSNYPKEVGMALVATPFVSVIVEATSFCKCYRLAAI